jgi:energy-coupling factor transport system permease protein
MTIPLYEQRNAPAEAWDPRAKMIAVLFLIIALMLNHRLSWMLGLCAGLALLWAFARLPWRLLGYTLASLAMLFVSTLIYHTLLADKRGAGGVIEVGGLALSRTGLYSGIGMSLQIAGIVTLLAFLVYSTPPLALAEGAEALLSPLKRLRFPVHDAVMIFTLAIRFLPVLAAEFTKIRNAQIARGAGLHRKSLPHRIKGVVPMLLPVFVQAILRAEELATAMDARCYQGGEGRTRLRVGRFGWGDGALVGVALAYFAASLAVRFGR